MESLAEYLRPTKLCDFDRAPEINNTAQRLVQNVVDKGEVFAYIYKFVKELPYGLEDWEISASHTLHKGWGMCSSKTKLLVAMCRTLMIPPDTGFLGSKLREHCGTG